MEPITPNSWISFFVIFILFVAFYLIIVYLIIKRGILNAKNAKERNKDDYENLYKQIQDHIHDETWGESVIRHEIMRLKSMSYKNPEKTHVLEIEFLSRYEIVNDN
jgi:outer membrane protein assembly factor BamD (BamD/ComL family)